MIMASLEFGIGSVGGFVAGPAHIVEHQSLNGLGTHPLARHHFSIPNL